LLSLVLLLVLVLLLLLLLYRRLDWPPDRQHRGFARRQVALLLLSWLWLFTTCWCIAASKGNSTTHCACITGLVVNTSANETTPTSCSVLFDTDVYLFLGGLVLTSWATYYTEAIGRSFELALAIST
jgi:hypothetical protein